MARVRSLPASLAASLAASRSAARRVPGLGLWLAVAVGVGLRMRQWAFDRSLWGDEAAVADQFLRDSYGRLLHPLTDNQGAPWGWLWLEKLASQAFGDSELALRLVPLAAGCAVLVLAALVARRLLRPLPAIVGLVALAVTEPLVYYSNDVKQYATDAAVVAGAFLLTLVVKERYRQRPRWLTLWAGLSAVFVLTSQPGVFAVGASACALFLDALAARRLRSAVLVVAASVPWAAAFGAEYVVDLRALRANHTLTSFWAAGFPPPRAGAGATLQWLGHDALRIVADPVGLSIGVAVLALFGVGLVRMAAVQPVAALFVALLVAVACVAAVIRVYPLDTRLALYLVAPVVLTACAAAGPRVLVAGRPASGAAHRTVPAIGWRVVDVALVLGASALLCASVASPVQAAARAVRRPYVTVESRPLIAFIDAHRHPGEAVFVQGYDLQPAVYYHWTMGFPVTGAFSYSPRAGCSSAPAVATMRHAATSDVWLLFGYPPPVPGGWSTIGDTIGNNEAMLAGLGRIQEVVRAPGPGSAAVLVDPNRPSTLVYRSRAPGCVVAGDIPASALRR